MSLEVTVLKKGVAVPEVVRLVTTSREARRRVALRDPGTQVKVVLAVKVVP